MRPIAVLVLSAAVFAAPLSALAVPAETRPANAPGQRPAFPDQTRAERPAGPTQVDVTTVTEGLGNAWGFAFLPDRRIMVTEKAGALRIVGLDGRPGPPLRGVPAVMSGGQGGLLDVALSPGFAQDRTLFLSFSEPRGHGSGTSVLRARLAETGGFGSLEDATVIFRQEPSWSNQLHFGSRIVPAPDGSLFVTVGERSDPEPRIQAQDLGSGLGKVFRIRPDGSVPPDNPFVGRSGALPSIWSYGHRNTQSAALDRAGRLWIVEHGPRGGDELNRPEAGRNYGWPEVTYGLDYSGAPIGAGVTQRAGTEQPVYYWDPVIAPSGMALYDADLFPAWRDAFLVGGLGTQGLVVLTMRDGRVAGEERIPVGARVRDVQVGPDGAVYLLTERDRGGSRILRLAPKT
ncbi:PQQ-dependent sugar dehydrogenase [Enterovirga sp.]|uniref:PQQ-dependent sugar dehydrogenase n=1 Tax=Enterovirga sp. TaxID=2026350 RepID=UPI002637C737|nr:PQQ-dependent sugar dehydrogenase [Enterovirga sp.]MDB5591532.1 glucose sorbosone dehydrogenase [Enterovirga sp.]